VLSAQASILVVDDEPALLESMRSYLSRLGYMVKAFRSGAAAWDYFSADPSACSVAIVDLTLHGMSGKEFIRKVLDRNPNMPILATSGYPPSLRTKGRQAREWLRKPFTPGGLTDVLDRLLNWNGRAAKAAVFVSQRFLSRQPLRGPPHPWSCKSAAKAQAFGLLDGVMAIASR
jgi:DNA-binding response OmpR family regulator